MASQEYVGLDLHRNRSVLVRMSADGEVVGRERFENSPAALLEAVGETGSGVEVALEATYGWYWAADVLEAAGVGVHLAHPLMVRAMGAARVKNDRKDATLLADLLRADLLPEAWIPSREVRENRELVRYRHKLVELRSGIRAQVHSVLAKEGVAVPVTDLFGCRGGMLLEGLVLGEAFRERIASLGRIHAVLDEEIGVFERRIWDRLRDDAGWRTIQAIRGVGPTFASVFCAEIGDVHRFRRPEQLSSWAGLTPRHRESDTKVRQGHITKQGSRLVRWAACEAVARYRPTARIEADYVQIARRRGKKVARVAAARKLLTLVFWGLRDHHIRDLEDER